MIAIREGRLMPECIRKFRREYEEGLRQGKADRVYSETLRSTGSRTAASAARKNVLAEVLPSSTPEAVSEAPEPAPWGNLGMDRMVKD